MWCPVLCKWGPLHYRSQCSLMFMVHVDVKTNCKYSSYFSGSRRFCYWRPRCSTNSFVWWSWSGKMELPWFATRFSWFATSKWWKRLATSLLKDLSLFVQNSNSAMLDEDLIQYYQFLADKGDVQAQVGFFHSKVKKKQNYCKLTQLSFF